MGDSGQIIYLLRHGETNYNQEKRIQGQTNEDSMLTEDAKKDVAKLASSFNKRISKIFSSDLLRAKQTADIFNQFANISEMEFTSDLRERGLGKLEGKTIWDLNLQDYTGRDLYALNNTGLLQSSETLESVEVRLRNLIERAFNSNYSTIIIIGHEWINSYLINILSQEDLIFHEQGNLRIHHIYTQENRVERVLLNLHGFEGNYQNELKLK